MISVGEICDRLRDKAEMLARELLPNAQRSGNYLKIGSIDGEPGQSMAIYLSGEKKGKWEDFGGDAHGDMLDLIAATQRLSSKGDAVAWAKRWLGIDDPWTPAAKGPSPEERARLAEDARARAETQQRREAAERAAKIRGAKALYLGENSARIAGTPAEWYLRGRLLEPVSVRSEPASWPGVLRYNPDVYHGGEKVKLPAMLAAVYLADGTHVATHRTWLQHCERRGWVKIDSPNAKMVLGPLGGGFIPINKGASGKPMSKMPAGEPVYVTEGIEDALTVRMIRPEARIICAISLGNIGAIVLPVAAKRLIIVADRDDKPRAQDALERAIARQQARGLEVSIVMPPEQVNGHRVKDFNDWLRAWRGGQRSGAA